MGLFRKGFFGANAICVIRKSAVQFTGQHQQLDLLDLLAAVLLSSVGISAGGMT